MASTLGGKGSPVRFGVLDLSLFLVYGPKIQNFSFFV